MLMILGLYVFCCMQALQGNLDLIPSSAAVINKLKFVNPFKKSSRRNSSVGIFSDNDDEEDDGHNRTDTDVC